MMILARLSPVASKKDLWANLAEALPKLRVAGVTPLYMSQHEEYPHVSIVFETSSPEALVPVLFGEFQGLSSIYRTRTVLLLQPLFFPSPRKRPPDLKRFQIALKVRTQYLKEVFDAIASMEIPPQILRTYQVLALGEDDILISVLCPSRGLVEAFVQDSIAILDGVVETTLTCVDKNLRLVSNEEWRRYRESRYAGPAPETADQEFDWLDATMRGAFVSEL